VAAFLHDRGHDVEVVITADGPPAPAAYPVHWVSRLLPKGVVHLRAAQLIAARARGADAIYSTGQFGRTSLAARLARTPYVLKVTADAAYERAYRLGLFHGTLQEFQRDRSLRTLPLRAERSSTVRGAAHLVCPSAYLGELAVGWGVAADRVSVLPNPVPPLPPLPARVASDAPRFVFAGRLTAQKSLEVAMTAVARIPGASLVIAGDGPDRAALERAAPDAVAFVGPLPRDEVLALFRSADAAVLSSSWENFPHTVVEALAVGTPVVATAVGGVPEAVEDGRNGLLVPVGDVEAFATAVRRIVEEPGLRDRLAAEAAPSVERFSPESVYGEIERILLRAAG
jgi:glycosyltransferase involved in cell wall biosynthesis